MGFFLDPAATDRSLIVAGRVGLGLFEPKDMLHIDGNLRLTNDQEIFFSDNGQIRSLDDNHRILFRRSENKMEFREFGDLIFSSGATSGQETAKALLTADGRFAIGTTKPLERLHVEGSGRFGNGQGHIRLGHDSANARLDNFGNGSFLINWSGSGDVAIGTKAGNKKDVTIGSNLTIQGHDFFLGTDDGRGVGNRPRQRALVHNHEANGARFDDMLVVNYGGDFEGGVHIQGPRVIVGTRHAETGDHKDYRLAVDGKLIAREIVVTDGPEWADDVFAEDYQLPRLRQVEEFIQQHGHLPAIPSAEEVREQGVDLGQMQASLLRKIEELTLYLLEIEKENRKLAIQLETLTNHPRQNK